MRNVKSKAIFRPVNPLPARLVARGAPAPDAIGFRIQRIRSMYGSAGNR